jgi:hypothetical protein
MPYLLDANIFITAKHTMPTDIWPTFWARLSEMMLSGQIYTIDKVKEEIDHGNDELTQWMKANAPRCFFISADSDVMAKYAEVQNWASSSGRFKQSALSEFASVADSYLVATAAAKDMIIVTYEASAPEIKKRVKIPDACQALSVDYCDLNAVLRALNVKL